MQIINRTNLPPEAFAELTRELPALGTLQQVAVWGSGMQPPVRLIETVAQDEYTHDVIAAWHVDLFFVFGST